MDVNKVLELEQKIEDVIKNFDPPVYIVLHSSKPNEYHLVIRKCPPTKKVESC